MEPSAQAKVSVQARLAEWMACYCRGALVMGNVGDINLHIAAWEKAAKDHASKGEHRLAEFAQSKADQFKAAYVPRHLR
jgi:hypothetical protein